MPISARTIICHLVEEGINARAHFQIWWALQKLALPKYESAINESACVDFFDASKSGHYILFLLALSKIFDKDSRVAGIRELKRALQSEGLDDIKKQITREIKPHEGCVKRILQIRNRSIAHNQSDISRENLYKSNPITPNQIRNIVDATCKSINIAATALNIERLIFKSNRAERATLNLLEALDRARHYKK
jgi:hypothetical protein